MRLQPFRANALQLLRASHALVRFDWFLVLAIELLVSAPWSVADNAVKLHGGDRMSILTLADFAMTAYAEAICVHLLIQRLTTGRKPSLGEALLAARRRLPVIAVFGILQTALGMAGFVLLVAPGLWVLASTWLVPPLLVMTPLGLWKAVRESHRRMSGYKLTVAGFVFALLPCMLLADWLSQLLGDRYDVVSELVGALSAPWFYASAAVLYCEQRPWHEEP